MAYSLVSFQNLIQGALNPYFILPCKFPEEKCFGIGSTDKAPLIKTEREFQNLVTLLATTSLLIARQGTELVSFFLSTLIPSQLSSLAFKKPKHTEKEVQQLYSMQGKQSNASCQILTKSSLLWELNHCLIRELFSLALYQFSKSV